MAFANEYISADDRLKYELDSINAKFIVGGTNARDWTIDRDRNIYLRVVSRGREEMASISTWTLFRDGDLIVFDLDIVGTTGGMGKPSSIHYKLLRLSMPQHLEAQREEVLADLYEALMGYRDGGVYGTAPSFSLILDICC